VLDKTPKFLKYRHHIGLISGTAWDHANVFPTEEAYVKQFDMFADNTPKGGVLIYCEQDAIANIIGAKHRADVHPIPYKSHPHASEKEQQFLTNGKDRYPINVFGGHNLQNLAGAKELLKRIGITPEMFFQAIQTFEGAVGRLEKLKESNSFVFYKDFAHAPSKVKASVKAMKEMHPSRELVACLELHTYSSLNAEFLKEYKGALDSADVAVVFYSPHAVEIKKLKEVTHEQIATAFERDDLIIYTNPDDFKEFLFSQDFTDKALLLMSSGNYGGLNFDEVKTLIE
jgi:UDP-N-acetylmuramate: L-alanyl-gamma-D-glutamyl-meso-diaminopimelate ligase